MAPTFINLERRYFENTNGSSGARWAFFAILIVLIIVAVIGTLRVNKKRSQHGAQPIYGTRWMTPPSYRQSQTQYNQPNRRDPDLPSAYVPTYTATANETDMGYYDASGKFHPNPNAKVTVAPPPAAHPREGTATDAIPLTNNFPEGTVTDEVVGESEHEDDIDDIYRAPASAPPRGHTPTHNFMLRTSGLNEDIPETTFTRPEGPPPPQEGSSSNSDSLPSFSEGSSPPKVSEKQTPIE